MIKKVIVVFSVLLFAASAQAQIVPYYGKNNVKYDTFDWKTYSTQHFDIYFYPQSQAHLQRVASMAESAYDKISADLQHDVEFRIPLIFFKTQSEFEQVNYLQISEGILGAAEPIYNRMAFAIDQPSDKLQNLISHELAHVFQFSMLFGGILTPLARVNPPQWVFEGHADYETGTWDPGDLMVVRDAVLTERLPFVSIDQGLISVGQDTGRGVYNIGHAVYEFMHDKYGEAAVRQFWFYMKKATLLGSEDVIFSAFGVKEEVFNEQFAQYLRERFKEYRDKQSPIDYGKEVSIPKKYFQVFSQAPSPNGQEFAIMTANRDDYEFDILKIDRTGKIVKNLTGGFTTSYDYITTDSFRFEGRNISWSSDGSHIAYFARTGKRRSLFIVNARNGDRIEKVGLKIDQAASPAISPDGRTVLFVGIQNGQPDLFSLDVQSDNIKKLTNDILYEKTPMWSPDGKWIFYTSRIHSRDQIMRMDANNPQHVEQLTFSDYNSTSPYYDPQTDSIFYSADRNNAFNLYRLDLNTGDKIQYTDVIGGNFSPVVFREGDKERLVFTTFFKGEYRLFIMELPKPVATIAKGSEPGAGETLQMSAEQAGKETPASGEGEGMAKTSSREFPTQGPVISDFQPTKELRVDPTKIKDKKFKVVIGGRPEVITGVSGSTFAVASGVVLQDILGDQEIRIFTSRIRGFQSYNVGYLDLGHRLQFLTDFIFNDDFYFVQVPESIALQTGFGVDVVRRRTYGGRFISQFPLNRYYRFEMGAGIFKQSERFLDNQTQSLFEDTFGLTRTQFLNNGNYLPLSLAFVGETTKFREFGPLMGHTFRFSVDYAVPAGTNWISRTIYDGDVRKYVRVTGRSLVAGRLRGFYTQGDNPLVFSFGGGLDIRGYDFREVIGHRGYIGNLEFRFPLYPNPRIPLLGQMRGHAFFDYFKMRLQAQSGLPESLRPLFFIIRNVGGQRFAISQEDGAGSIGAGFTVFAGGLPLNFDFAKVFGYGRFADANQIIHLSDPVVRKFADGLGFDFSIGYDF
jgi:Tol biopolymer transport system component